MLRRLSAAALALAAVLTCPCSAGAQPPAPIDPKLFSFPGVATMPATALFRLDGASRTAGSAPGPTTTPRRSRAIASN